MRKMLPHLQASLLIQPCICQRRAWNTSNSSRTQKNAYNLRLLSSNRTREKGIQETFKLPCYLNNLQAPYAHTSPQLLRYQSKTGHGAFFTPAQVKCHPHNPVSPSLLLAQGMSKAPQLSAAGLPQAVVLDCLCLSLQVAAWSVWRQALLSKEQLLSCSCTHTAAWEFLF